MEDEGRVRPVVAGPDKKAGDARADSRGRAAEGKYMATGGRAAGPSARAGWLSHPTVGYQLVFTSDFPSLYASVPANEEYRWE